MKQKIADRIRRIRLTKDFTQENMADELGITFGAYSKIERGQTDPNTSRLEQIAKILKVNITEFFEEKSSLLLAAEEAKSYGFAPKEDVENLTKVVLALANKVEKLSQKLEQQPVKKTRKGK